MGSKENFVWFKFYAFSLTQQTLQGLRPRMADTTQNRPPAAASAQPQPTKVGVMPLFSTWIYRCENGPTHLNAPLEQLARKLMQDERNATRRTNYGGWHYAFDVFELKEAVMTEFHNETEQHVQAFLNHFRPEGR